MIHYTKFLCKNNNADWITFVHGAGGSSTELTDKIIVDAIHQIGYQVEERDNFYNPIRVL